MNKLKRKLEEIKNSKQLGLMTHVIVGYPSLSATKTLVKCMAESGADIIELQIPFSDPLADGPTIMHACEKALEKGTKVSDAFTIMRELSQEVQTPLLFMAYYNTVFTHGVERFCKDSQRAGAAGLIVPDIPIEEEAQEHFIKYCKKYGLYTIRVVSPVTTIERLQKNAQVANGFIYCTARQGITGTKKTLEADLISYIRKVKKYIPLPLAVGFGISKKEHVQTLKDSADIAVIGSALIDVIDKSTSQTLEQNVKHFLASLIV